MQICNECKVNSTIIDKSLKELIKNVNYICSIEHETYSFGLPHEKTYKRMLFSIQAHKIGGRTNSHLFESRQHQGNIIIINERKTGSDER